MTAIKSLLAVVLASLMVTSSHAGVIPDAVCTGLELAFQIFGCAAEEKDTPQCTYLAIILRLKLGEEGLCDKEPCFGYGVPGSRTCTGVFSGDCDDADTVAIGICPFAQECCDQETISGKRERFLHQFAQSPAKSVV